MSKENKFYAVMFFNTEIELGMSNTPNKWVNTGIYLTENGSEALMVYAETPNPASQLLEAKTEKELEEKIDQMKENFKSEQWLNEELYPFL